MTRIIGHRGSPVSKPENTLSSFRQALESGAYAVEFDVRRSLDGELMVFHDEHSSRVTEHTGLVGSYTSQELESFSVSGSEATIPTFSRTVDFLFNSSKCPDPREIRVETKERGLARQILEVVEKNDCRENTVIQSFTPSDLYEVQEVSGKGFRTALLAQNPGERHLDIAERLECEIVSVPYSEGAEHHLEKARSRGFKTDLWVESTREAINRGLDLEPDYLGTDAPELAVKALKHKRPEQILN